MRLVKQRAPLHTASQHAVVYGPSRAVGQTEDRRVVDKRRRRAPVVDYDVLNLARCFRPAQRRLLAAAKRTERKVLPAGRRWVWRVLQLQLLGGTAVERERQRLAAPARKEERVGALSPLLDQVVDVFSRLLDAP